ncbi:unnamed protein product (macronuclear) [Paramecium tetraurelia]|uniref:Uncharacterized protein n=1 Tax=Paramecium tetraurelia TaxID=5888 RepID=A0C3W4_PARTE|nr:uncharacterized protein GSPATT00034960001 [Paramecium tetraurelia]CAK65481.1 unnamed protein product [Paramecium tetraurelia]
MVPKSFKSVDINRQFDCSMFDHIFQQSKLFTPAVLTSEFFEI